MSYCGVTAAVLDSIEKMYRDFLWGDTAEHRRLHLVSWEKICKRKEEGGLGFRCLDALAHVFVGEEPGQSTVPTLVYLGASCSSKVFPQ